LEAEANAAARASSGAFAMQPLSAALRGEGGALPAAVPVLLATQMLATVDAGMCCPVSERQSAILEMYHMQLALFRCEF